MDLSIIEQFEAQTLELTGEALKYHKLANAIRKGSKLRPQCTNGYYFEEETGSSCAIGAVFEVITGRSARGAYPQVVATLIKAGLVPSGFSLRKVFAFNDLGWTRESIADRLDDVAYGRREEF